LHTQTSSNEQPIEIVREEYHQNATKKEHKKTNKRRIREATEALCRAAFMKQKKSNRINDLLFSPSRPITTQSAQPNYSTSITTQIAFTYR